MKTLEYGISFTTPAFLGDANQDGRWRTPPFKALLRQWWRVVYAADHGFPVDTSAMRREEGLLFGNAWLKDQFCKSRIRLRLDRWDMGQLNSWQPLDKVDHPEVKFPVGSDLYLGFGPLLSQRKATALKKNAAIQAGESARISIAIPTNHKDAELRRLFEANAPRIERAISLMDRYGAIGGRSRNGWGSFTLTPADGTPALDEDLRRFIRPWQDALGLDWPHTIGSDDEGPLIWSTNPMEGWKALMRDLARIKIGLRTQFEFTSGNNARKPEDRHWLSHPVTKHNVKPWNNGRLPNSLRFKVRKDENGKLRGTVFHVPALPPPQFSPDPRVIEQVWIRVHRFLDRQETLERTRA